MGLRPDEDGDHQLRLLEAAWQQAMQHWHDDLARHFETRHWTPLTQESRSYLAALRGLMEVLAEAERDMEL